VARAAWPGRVGASLDGPTGSYHVEMVGLFRMLLRLRVIYVILRSVARWIGPRMRG
jgi:hypothetical protein